MPINREPIFHDKQFTFNETSQNTSSTTFVDITGATLTTRDLSQDSCYTVFFSVEVEVSSANTVVSFRALVNGVHEDFMDRDLKVKISGTDVGFTFLSTADNLVEGDVIQFQWKTDKGTVTMPEFNLLIEGIPQVRIVA